MPYGIGVLAHAGMTNAEALSAGTAVAAAACGLGDRKGSLAPGRDADLLVVGGDPLADIAALLDVRAVYRAGQRVAVTRGS
jgi:imidazolonepropionase-like amidohydrolase